MKGVFGFDFWVVGSVTFLSLGASLWGLYQKKSGTVFCEKAFLFGFSGLGGISWRLPFCFWLFTFWSIGVDEVLRAREDG